MTVVCGTESGQYAHNVFRMFDVQHNGCIRFVVSRSSRLLLFVIFMEICERL